MYRHGDRQIDAQTHVQIDRQTQRYTYSKTYRQAGQTGIQIDRIM